MGLNNYPYTNFHEMNLDWILEQFQKEVARLEALEAFAAQAGQDITQLKSQVNILNTAITTLQNAQNTLTERQDALEVLVNGYNQRITTNTNNIASLAAWQTTANSTLADHESRIDTLEDTIDDLVTEGLPQQVIDDLMDYVRDNLPELLEPLEADITALQTAMTAAQTAITALQSGKLNAGMGVTTESDLNEIITAGIYLCLPAYTLINLPTTGWGELVLQVLRASGNDSNEVIQIAYALKTTGVEMYYRYAEHLTSPTESYEWEDWSKVLINSDLTAIESSVSDMEPALEQLVKQVPNATYTNYTEWKAAVIAAGSSREFIASISSTCNEEITGNSETGITIAKHIDSANRIDFVIISPRANHITTGYVDLSDDSITLADFPISKNTLSYKTPITSSADLNDYNQECGTYLMSSIPSNAPDNAKTYSMLLVIKSPTSIDTTQVLIHGTSGLIWTRRYHGSPAVWDSWSEISRANVIRVIFNGSIPSMTTWGYMKRTATDVLAGDQFGVSTEEGIRLDPGTYKVTAIAQYPAKSSGWYGVALSMGGSNLPYFLSGCVHTQAGFSGAINRLSATGVMKITQQGVYKVLFGSNQTSMSDISGALIIERIA